MGKEGKRTGLLGKTLAFVCGSFDRPNVKSVSASRIPGSDKDIVFQLDGDKLVAFTVDRGGRRSQVHITEKVRQSYSWEIERALSVKR